MPTITIPEQGQLVEVRQRRYVVRDVLQSALPRDLVSQQDPAPQHFLTLSSVEDDALGEELEVVWEIEPGARVIERGDLPQPDGFDDPKRFNAFLDAVRWGAIASADPRALQAPFRSGITIADYQLDPVARAIQMPRANLLIADDVGLGKTIEAGLVVQEFILRHRVRTVLIVCPSGLQIQWREQMRDKFGLEFRIVDAELMRELRRSQGIRANPWTHFPRLITSIDYLKRDRPLRLFTETLPADGHPTYPRTYDLLIVDEAHNVAPSGGGRYATDSQRTLTIRKLAPHFEHKLFLTATPHNGYRESFTALLELLDNQRFARGVRPTAEHLRTVMVRRLKSEMVDWNDEPLFPKRILHALEVAYDQEEQRMHTLLQRYTRSRRTRLVGDHDQTERVATEFVLKLLKKRLFSSPAAFAKTLAQYEQSLETATKRGGRSMPRPSRSLLQQQFEQLDEFGDDQEVETVTEDALLAATRLFRPSTEEEQQLLGDMRRWASHAADRPDSKVAELIKWLHSTLRPNGQWNDERVIIFTEYRDTQRWLQTILAAHGFTRDERLKLLYGGMASDERERIKAAFQAAPDVSSVRILLATDSASEGIDLQNYCSRLIHLEIPWNPNRMEQRNGRVDRHGQKAKEVEIFHFVAAGWRERQRTGATAPSDLAADLEFLMRAAQKVDQIREDLGKVGPVIAQQVEEAMLGERRALDTARAERDDEPTRRMLKFERHLRQRIEELRQQLDETRSELGLSPDHIRTVVSIALELAGQPALREARVPGMWPDPTGRTAVCPVWEVPSLHGAWAVCTEGLVHPHTRQQRPIVFDHALAKGRDDVVLVHLQHRLVQMALRLLRAEVWAPAGQRKLHRVTARVVPDRLLETPAVIAHARLVVLGGDHQRLHEELITAGGVLRGGGSNDERFARLNVTTVNNLLDTELPVPVSQAMLERLQKLWPSHVSALLQSLDVRARDRSQGMLTKLAEREEQELKASAAVLNELRTAIEGALKRPEVEQLSLFTDAEQEQFERNMDALQARVASIPTEIEREAESIRKRYANPQTRLFPVAVTYLIPERLAK